MKTSYKILGTLALALGQAVAQSPGQSAATAASDVETTSRGLQVGDPVEVGQPLHGADPAVPREFREKNGSLVLHATITADGGFADIAVVSGDPALTGLAVEAVQQWRYSPCTLNGAPIGLPAYIAFIFNKGKVKRSLEPDLPFPTKPAQAGGGAEEVFRVRQNGTTVPQGSYLPDPEYSETARIAKYSGTVVLGMVVGPDGNPRDVWVTRKLGLGLDQKAIETVRKWKFKPATKDGQPVAVILDVEVSFHLY